jgi:hypothetical protein
MPSGIPQPETEDMVVEESQSPETELDSEESSKFDGWDGSCSRRLRHAICLISSTYHFSKRFILYDISSFFVCTVFQLKDRFTVSFLSIPIYTMNIILGHHLDHNRHYFANSGMLNTPSARTHHPRGNRDPTDMYAKSNR